LRYWWVNQNQTFRHEIAGGYLWSPKRKTNDARNHYYECMREVAIGDIVFSFVGTKILAIGVAQSYCFECPKPLEFGTAGMNWENIGWKVRVNFVQLRNQVRPKDHMGILASLLPTKYSPLRPNGDGLQSVYLAEVPKPFAEVLAGLIGAEAGALLHQAATLGLPAGDQATPHTTGDDLDYWEHRLEQTVVQDAAIPETEREAIVRSRRGQGLFKQRVLLHERRCRVTGVDRLTHLVASHCKPWRDSSNEERLDGENGLLLTPSIDHLFDRGFIGFEDSGRLIISPVAHKPSLRKMGVESERPVTVGDFTAGQKQFLDWHRDKVLLMAVR
jgi:putative restriction endonuclease